ncbi:hypothetical protein ACJMK2_032604 [Sinanodonta woodiana]|uniref:Uncharacterized protein n=1 Tax=Sinanodonta woodiana TaxID=1069815 RepID=A0ABD3X661_SINWO
MSASPAKKHVGITVHEATYAQVTKIPASRPRSGAPQGVPNSPQATVTKTTVYHNSQKPGPSKKLTEADLIYASQSKKREQSSPPKLQNKWIKVGK